MRNSRYPKRDPIKDYFPLPKHGLFSQTNDKIDLDKMCDEVANHKGVIWTHVVSLTREDAERLGYNKAAAWRELVRRNAIQIAEAHKIHISEMKWYAAFHNTTHHPHIHLVIFSENIKHGYLTKKGIDSLHSIFANDIFRNEIILPPSLLQILSEYKKTVDSEWVFPSPIDSTRPRTPSAVRNRLQLILERAGCPRVRFHDLRHTFATMALENGMDVKTLSTTIGHVSSATTIDIYSHITDTMQRQAAAKIDRQIGSTEAEIPRGEQMVRIDTLPPNFEPYKPKYRRSGTGCVTMINDHLFEGRYSPRNAYGKREAHNIYAKTREECEEKLAAMIAQVKAGIKAEKERLKTANKSFSLEIR